MTSKNKSIQKKREKKKVKRQKFLDKRRKSGDQTSAIPLNCNRWPIYECWFPDEIWQVGLGHVIIVRKNEQDQVAVGGYLVDTLKEGVKDCSFFLTIMTCPNPTCHISSGNQHS